MIYRKTVAVEYSCPIKRKCTVNHKHPTTNYVHEILRWDEASFWYPRHLLEISACSCLDVTCSLVFRSIGGRPCHSAAVGTARLVFQFGAAVNVALGCRLFCKTPRDYRRRKRHLVETIRCTDCIITWHFSAFRKPQNLMPREDTQKTQNLTQKK